MYEPGTPLGAGSTDNDQDGAGGNGSVSRSRRTVATGMMRQVWGPSPHARRASRDVPPLTRASLFACLLLFVPALAAHTLCCAPLAARTSRLGTGMTRHVHVLSRMPYFCFMRSPFCAARSCCSSLLRARLLLAASPPRCLAVAGRPRSAGRRILDACARCGRNDQRKHPRAQVDTDGDGLISRDEFRAVLTEAPEMDALVNYDMRLLPDVDSAVRELAL